MNDVPTTTVGLVGLGIISETHLKVLSEQPAAELAFTVDPVADPPTFRGARHPHYVDINVALAEHDPDLVVIATPTLTHVDLALAALAESSARVLIEKPIAGDIEPLRRFLDAGTHLGAAERVLVAHHFAFSPEVRWAAELLDAHPEWGPVTEITCVSHDPYVLRGEEAFGSYVSSWMDSGINQMSMVTRFVALDELTSRHESDDGAAAWCTARFTRAGRSGSARFRTSWLTGSSSKHASIRLGESGVEVLIDNTALTGIATRGPSLIAALDNDGTVPRKIAHYRPLYETVLSNSEDEALSLETAVHLTELLVSHPGHADTGLGH